MKKVINKKTLILIATILLLCGRMIYLYNLRCFHFIDEFYSVGFANSKGEPLFLYYENDENGNENLKHYQEWCSGNDIREYLTVDENERFDFANVIDNKLQDTAPANYEIMIHFVASLFPGTFSWAYSFSVNFVFYIGSLILVYFISLSILRDKKIGFINAYLSLLFFAFSIVGSGAFTFLRMYGVLSFYGLLMMLSIQRLIMPANKKQGILFGIILYLSVFLGLFTHTLFVVFAFWLTLFSCLYLFITKKRIDSVKLGSIVLAALLTFMAVYPFRYNRVGSWMSGENHNGYSFFTRLIFSNMHMFGESLGFYIPFTYANILTWSGIALMIFFIMIFICYLFRKEKWFASFKKRALEIIVSFKKKLSLSVNNISPFFYIILLTSVAYMLTVTVIAPIGTQYYVSRYFMIAQFPTIICFVSMIISFWDSFKGKSRYYVLAFSIAILALLIYRQNFVYGNPYYFNMPYDNEEEIHKLTTDSDVMIVGNARLNLYNLMVPLRDVNSFYFTDYHDGVENVDSIPDKKFYFMIARDVFEGEDGVKSVVDGLRLEGTTEEYIRDFLNKFPGSYSIEKIRTYNSVFAEYDVYSIDIS